MTNAVEKPSTRRKRPQRDGPIFLGLNEVAGYLSGLERGLREIGLQAELHDLSGNPFGYGLRTRARVRMLGFAGANPGIFRRRIWDVLLRTNRLRKSITSMVLLPWWAIRYDTFILEGRDLFLNGRGLWLLRKLRKRVIVIFLGSDHRPPYLNGIWLEAARRLGYAGMNRDTRRTVERIRRVERYADAIIALPMSAQFHTRSFLHITAIGFPLAADASREPSALPPQPRPVRVLHCPTDPESKGSDRIRAAVDQLRAKGVALELRQLSGVPHAEVMRAILTTDFVVDEVFSDTPMAAFSAEAAFHGRPAIVGGYAYDQFGGLANLPPTLFCHPDELEAAIKRLTTDAELRNDLGSRARAFVRGAWSPKAVAGRVLRVISGDIEKAWVIRPQEINYLHGWGADEESLSSGLRAFVDAYGSQALRLHGRPDLTASLLALVAKDADRLPKKVRPPPSEAT